MAPTSNDTFEEEEELERCDVFSIHCAVFMRSNHSRLDGGFYYLKSSTTGQFLGLQTERYGWNINAFAAGSSNSYIRVGDPFYFAHSTTDLISYSGKSLTRGMHPISLATPPFKLLRFGRSRHS